MKAIGTIEKSHAEITARDGEIFLVDTDDLDVVGNFGWRVDRHGYVVRSGWDVTKTHKRKGFGDKVFSGGGKIIKLHRELAKKHKIALPGEFIDHINRNKLDNRLSNLRKVTHHQNTLNLSKRVDNKSGQPGVFLSNDTKRRKRWVAFAGNLKKRFLTFEEAVIWRKEQFEKVVKECGL